MSRILFEKKGNAIWISHLDLMRVFQRAFKRSGLNLTHTQGYNPRPSVSIALPLSVGVESNCELLDFDLDGDKVANRIVRGKLNDYLVPGIKVIKVYDNGAKIKHLALLDTIVTLEYDAGVPADGVQKLRERRQAYAETVTPDCREGCAGCGANCLLKEVKCDE